MARNLGYGFEHEVEEFFMALEGQKRSDPLYKRSHRQPASGAMASAKGDVVSELDFLKDFGQFMVECKDRKGSKGDGKSVSVKKAELDKCRFEAHSDGMHPLFGVKVKQPVGGDRTPIFRFDRDDPMGIRWFAAPFYTWRLLLEYVRDLVIENRELRAELEGDGF